LNRAYNYIILFTKFWFIRQVKLTSLFPTFSKAHLINRVTFSLHFPGIFVEDILPILSAMGPGISNDPVMFTKLIRISVAFIDSHKLSTTSPSSSLPNEKEQTPPRSVSGTSTPSTLTRDSPKKKETSTVDAISALSPNELAFYNQIYTLLNDVLMPSLSMISMNPSLAIEFWNLLKLFPYEMRYYLYNNWRQNSYKHFPQLIRAKAECTEKIKYLLK